MADNVTRVVTADVYAWMTPVEGVPGRFHHNTAVRGQVVELSAEEAQRGDALELLVDPDAVRSAAEDATDAADEAARAAEEARTAEEREAESRSLLDAAGGEVPTERPPRAAAKAAWVDYAVTQGADRAEADGMSKDDLIAAYGA
jgi:hypothetical protein